MSQIEVNTNYNSVNVENTINTIDVNQDFGNILIVPQQTTNIVEIVTPGPQGAQGPPGDINTVTGSFVLTSSFNAFTASYNTGSFTGSFKGDGSGLTNISASNIVGLNLSQIASGSATASISPNNGFRVNTNTIITGSLFVTNGITGSLFGTSSYAITASYASNVPLTASFAVSASQAISASYAVSASYEIVYEESSSYADYAVSASQAVTASYALNVPLTASFAVSASQAITASYVLGGIFPYTGSAAISGSLEVTGSISNTTTLTTSTFINPQTISVDINIPPDSNALIIGPVGIQEELSIGSGSNLIILESLGNLATTSSNIFDGNQTINGDVYISSSQISYQNSINVGIGTEIIATVDKNAYSGAFYDYVISNGTSFKAGTVTSVWNKVNGDIDFFDNISAILGNPSEITLLIDIIGENTVLIAVVNSGNWIIKVLVRAL
jgi:hypothetical protein